MSKILKELALAYEAACIFDYCPDPTELEDAKEEVPKITVKVLDFYQGLRPHEIAERIISEIEKL